LLPITALDQHVTQLKFLTASP